MNLPAPPKKTLTLEYKRVADLPIHLDVYLPPNAASSSEPRPVVVYFHGGGLNWGDKDTFFPTWMYDRASAAGFVFVSPDYRLVTPSNGHDVVEDIKDVFKFVATHLNEELRTNGINVRVDPTRIAASGNSAGGLCAYLAGIHAEPKPKVLLSMYGMGGSVLIPHYFNPKNSTFVLGIDYIHPSTMSEFIYPASKQVPLIAASPVAWNPEPSVHPVDNPSHPNAVQVGPGFPKTKRMLLYGFNVQQGVWLDHYTGSHEPSFSSQLRSKPPTSTAPSELKKIVPAEHQALFPQLHTANFPPTFLVHGNADEAVLVDETRDLTKSLQDNGVEAIFKEVEGVGHGFDGFPGAKEKYDGLFDEAYDFVIKHL